ncbi:MAG TPA: adenylate/guanylate cyclase domain-containing protein [Spirochaetota bacterium]|nr:adenylate/guanylate cyclase domain-containing protein [Spirochaetota bacterium]
MPDRNSIIQSASADRLAKLIRARMEPGADKDAIDRRIWDLFGETWCIMFTDLSGFSRNVARFGIIHFLQTIQESERLLVPVISEHDGILLKTEGDSMLVIFRTAQRGLECALAMQHLLEPYNAAKAPEEQVLLCIGLGSGPVLKIGDSDVFGTEVNAASKLGEDTARAREILVTGSVEEACRNTPGCSFEPIDEIPPGAERAFRVLYS